MFLKIKHLAFAWACLQFFSQPLALEAKVYKDAKKGKEFIILTNPSYNPGLFSVFCTILGVLEIYDKYPEKYMGLEVNLSSGIYIEPKVGPNWWEYFFEPIKLGNPHFPRKRAIDDWDKNLLAHRVVDTMKREKGAKLINKYIRVKPNIAKKVKCFVSENFDNDFIIGIHYRGTDKVISEARRISYENMEKEVKKLILNIENEGHKKYKIFIATDEEPFLDFMKKTFKQIPIIYTDCARAKDGKAVHLETTAAYASNYKKGLDAVMDFLLLSRCHVMIRTSSNLSFCATLMNPDLRVILLE